MLEIEYIDKKIERVRLSTLKPGDTFISDDDEMGYVNIFLRRDDDNYEFMILSEYPEIVSDVDHNVRIVKAKLLVEI